MVEIKKKLTSAEKDLLLGILEERFHKNMNRHEGLKWDDVLKKLNANPGKLCSIYAMEHSGGEPDVVDYRKLDEQFVFFDCSKESPTGRRSVCYDKEALESRKKFKPKDNACGLAEGMGVEMLNEAEYLHLQTLGDFDTKTSSWIQTPSSIRERGGALFADFRYGKVFFYHNGVESYYAARGFRTGLFL